VLQALRAHQGIINRAFAQAGKVPTATKQALAPLACGLAAFWLKPKPAFPPITGAYDPNGVAAIGKTNHQNPARSATDAKQPRFLSTMSFISRDHRFRVIKGGCRFAEIDAVLRNVRFFFLGIPFKSHQFFTLPTYGTTSIQNCNITLWVARRSSPITRHFRFNALTIQFATGVNAPATADHCPIMGLGADAAWGAASATE